MIPMIVLGPNGKLFTGVPLETTRPANHHDRYQISVLHFSFKMVTISNSVRLTN